MGAGRIFSILLSMRSVPGLLLIAGLAAHCVSLMALCTDTMTLCAGPVPIYTGLVTICAGSRGAL